MAKTNRRTEAKTPNKSNKKVTIDKAANDKAIDAAQPPSLASAPPSIEKTESDQSTEQIEDLDYITVEVAAKKCGLSLEMLFHEAARGKIEVCAKARGWRIQWGDFDLQPPDDSTSDIAPAEEVPMFIPAPEYSPEYLENQLVGLRPSDIQPLEYDDVDKVHVQLVQRRGGGHRPDGEVLSPKSITILKRHLIVTAEEVRKYQQANPVAEPFDEDTLKLKKACDKNHHNFAAELRAAIELWIEFWSDPEKHPKYNEKEQHEWLKKKYSKVCEENNTRLRLIRTAKPNWKKAGGANKIDPNS